MPALKAADAALVGLAVHQRVQRGIGQPELDRQVPARPQVLDGVRRVVVDVLGRQERGEAVLGHRVEQPLLVAEQPVDGRRLQAGRDRDPAGGDRVAALAGQQVDGGLDDPLADLLAARGACRRLGRVGGRHAASDCRAMDVMACINDTAMLDSNVNIGDTLK